VTLAGSANLPCVVHHELCHAWDQGHGPPGDKENVFDIEGTETRKDRAEVLATVCGIAVMEPAGLGADGGWRVPEGCEPPVRDAVQQILATDAAVWVLESPWGEEPRLVRFTMPGLD
jgi:hypothetical protein